METILKNLGINKFIAIKKFYNDCVGSNDFYKMINRRLKYQSEKNLAIFLNNEFEIYLKEFAQYQ